MIMSGGTFLEGLTVDEGDYVQLPVAPGHAIIHETTQRHAGAPTTSGIRDILVVFLSTRRPKVHHVGENTWGIEKSMRLASIGSDMIAESKKLCLQAARRNNPSNSEVPYWLGIHLVQGDMDDPSDERWAEISEGVEYLQLATSMNPADARSHYQLGMALASRFKYAMRTRRIHLHPPAQQFAEGLIHAFETAIQLEEKCNEAGCSNGLNLPAAFFALGDNMLRLKDFEKARVYLNQVRDAIGQAGDMNENWAQSMLEEVGSMNNYCDQKEEEKKKMWQSSLVQ